MIGAIGLKRFCTAARESIFSKTEIAAQMALAAIRWLSEGLAYRCHLLWAYGSRFVAEVKLKLNEWTIADLKKRNEELEREAKECRERTQKAETQCARYKQDMTTLAGQLMMMQFLCKIGWQVRSCNGGVDRVANGFLQAEYAEQERLAMLLHEAMMQLNSTASELARVSEENQVLRYSVSVLSQERECSAFESEMRQTGQAIQDLLTRMAQERGGKSNGYSEAFALLMTGVDRALLKLDAALPLLPCDSPAIVHCNQLKAYWAHFGQAFVELSHTVSIGVMNDPTCNHTERNSTEVFFSSNSSYNCIESSSGSVC